MNPWEKYAAKPSSGPWEKRQEAEPPVIATTKDGGKVYRMPDGSMAFKNDAMATNNQDTIKKLMEGATPVEASTYGNVSEGGRLGTAVRSGVQGMTFGGGDEAIAGVTSLLSGNSYDTELQRERARLEKGRENNPGTALTSEIAGAVALPLSTIAKTTKYATPAANLAGDVAKSAAQGGGLSAVYGFLSGEGGAKERIADALSAAKWGAGIGAAIPVAGAAVQSIANKRAASKAIAAGAKNAPTAEALRAEGNAAYRAIDDAGVRINPSTFNETAGGISAEMVGSGLDTGSSALNLTPKAARLNQILGEMGQTNESIPFSAVDQLRRKAGEVASDVRAVTGRPTLDAKLGTGAIGSLDDMVQKLTPENATGDVEALKTLIPKARDVWTRMSKSQLVEDAISAGNENYLSGASSGIRNQFKRILSNPKLIRGFSEGEKTAMRKVVNGSVPEQIITLLGGGLGNLATIGGGFGVGGPMGAAVGAAAGAGLRKGAGAIANRNAEIARALVANGRVGNLPVASSKAAEIMNQLLRQGTAAALPK